MHILGNTTFMDVLGQLEPDWNCTRPDGTFQRGLLVSVFNNHPFQSKLLQMMKLAISVTISRQFVPTSHQLYAFFSFLYIDV